MEKRVYRNVGREIWVSVQVKLREGWWERPETVKLFRVCRDREEAEALVKILNSGGEP